MPVKVNKVGKKFCVMEVGAKGKPAKGRCFTSKAQAVKQAQAINISLIRSGKIKPKGGTPAIVKKPYKKK